jgi:hypothetical protein
MHNIYISEGHLDCSKRVGSAGTYPCNDTSFTGYRQEWTTHQKSRVAYSRMPGELSVEVVGGRIGNSKGGEASRECGNRINQ